MLCQCVRTLGIVVCVLVLTGPKALAQDTQETPEDVLRGSLFSEVQQEAPIYIPDSSNPRATMQSFLALTREMKSIFAAGNQAGALTDPQIERLIELYGRLTYLLDTTELPGSERFALAHVAGTRLSEVLDRIKVPPLEAVPDLVDVTKSGKKFWRVPNTEITLSRVPGGARKDDWVFSADTVEGIETLYHKVHKMPYRPDANVGRISEVGGLLEHYIVFTGPIIPYNFTQRVPEWARVEFFDEPIWKYIATALSLLVVALLAFFIQRLTRFRSDRSEDSQGVLLSLRRLILPVSLAFMLLLVSSFITFEIRLRLGPMAVVNDILLTLFYLVAFWIVLCLGNLVASLIIVCQSISSRGLDASLVRLSTRVLSYIIGFWVLIEGVQRLGLSFVPLIAGVSIGGLAFAMAARPTLGNLLAGILIFADRPFTVGHRVIVGKNDGVIEDIGLRSTRLRTLDGHLVTIPNEDICNNDVINIARRPNIRRTMNVTLTYDTPVDKIDEAVDIIRKLLSVEEDEGKTEEELQRPSNSHVNESGRPPKVFFNDLNADSLNIKVTYWFAPPDNTKYMEHAHWFNKQLLRRYADAGINFAFPTQTIELSTPAVPPESATKG